MRDFDVHFADGRIVAVEVSCFTDSLRVQQLAEIEGRSPWVFPDLEHGWHLTVDEDAQIGRLHEEASSLLRVVEAKGIVRLRMTIRPESDADDETNQAVSKLAELRVAAASALDAIPPRLLIPVYPLGCRVDRSGPGHSHSQLIGSEELELLRTNASFFIWVEYAQAMTMAALAFALLVLTSVETSVLPLSGPDIG